MTERKTKEHKTGLTVFRPPSPADLPAIWVPPDLPDDAGDLPAVWVPPDLPASTNAPGRAIAKHDEREGDLPAIWVPADLPPSRSAPAVTTDHLDNFKPWVPDEAPRNLPAASKDKRRSPVVLDEQALVERQKKKKRRKKDQAGELTTETGQAGGQTIINIVNQVETHTPFYGPWWGGWWGWRGYDPSDGFWGWVGIFFFVVMLLGLLAR